MFWGTEQKPSIHLIGIGGSGMSGIAEVLLASGFSVSGSDLTLHSVTHRLQALGARIFQGHKSEHIQGATCVVVSSAVTPDNPEWQAARKQDIPVIPRAEMLAELMRLKQGVAITGSHGKTTTTSFTGQLLASLDPTVVVGGRVQHWNSSTLVGKSSLFVIEADESDRSFLRFSPVVSLITNVDREHLEAYKNFEDLENTFLEFLNRTAFFGRNWICLDCPTLSRLRSRMIKPTWTYGFHPEANLRIEKINCTAQGSRFSLSFQGEWLGNFQIPIPGKHNALNATGSIGLALTLGIKINRIKKITPHLKPVERRLQIHEDQNGIVVIEDYGHHPTEIEATLETIQLMYPKRKIFVWFQPHRYTRTQTLISEFVECFRGRSEKLFLLPIYSAHETPLKGIDSHWLASKMNSISVEVLESVPTAEEVLKKISNLSVILILGAGPLTPLAIQVAERVSQCSNTMRQVKNR